MIPVLASLSRVGMVTAGLCQDTSWYPRSSAIMIRMFGGEKEGAVLRMTKRLVKITHRFDKCDMRNGS